MSSQIAKGIEYTGLERFLFLFYCVVPCLLSCSYLRLSSSCIYTAAFETNSESSHTKAYAEIKEWENEVLGDFPS
jgi:hypothetical protein